MCAEQNQVGPAEVFIETKPGSGPSPKPGREEPSGARPTPRTWLGDAPSGDEAGTHVVSRIGVCRVDPTRRWTKTV